MERTVVVIPRMFSQEDFKQRTGIIPEDFNETSREFWNYIEEKLTPLKSKVKRIYSVIPLEDMRGQIEVSENGEYPIIKELVENGSELIFVEDPVLVAEVDSWLGMMKTSADQGIFELYEDSLRDRDEHVVKTIVDTLKDGEIGVFITDIDHKLSLPEDTRLIRMCRFDPEDYLKRWKTKLELGKQAQKG